MVKKPTYEELDEATRADMAVALEKLKNEISVRKQAEAALRESERRYRLLIESIPTVAWVTSPDGRTVFISSNVEKVYVYTPDEVLIKGEELWLGRIHPDDRNRVIEAFRMLFVCQMC